jgi:hypothetical protein
MKIDASSFLPGLTPGAELVNIQRLYFWLAELLIFVMQM